MTAQQIIDACISGKWTAEQIIIKNDFGTAKMIQYFNLDPQESTTELKHRCVDKINELIETPEGIRTCKQPSTLDGLKR